MSYTLQLWEKPADWPWPTTKAEADAQFERVSDGPETAQNPKFLLWGQALHARFPEDMDVWLDGSEEGVTTFPTLGFGINTRTPHWDDAFDHAWAQATRLGLSLYDPQSGVHYLGNGDVPEEPDLQVHRALRARKAGDDATAWAEYRAWAARGNPHAIYALGRAMRFGILGQRRHFDLGAALQLMGAHDAETQADAQAFFEKFPPEAKVRIQALLARLKAAAGEPLLQLIDAERKAVDDAFDRTEQTMLYSRKRIEAAGGLEVAAALGHEVAAFHWALEVVIGWEEPHFENARYWCQRATEWDHEPAKRLLALMHEHGWGGPVDKAAAAQWNAAAQEQRQQAQKLQQRKDEAASPQGLSLAPVEAKPSTAVGATAQVWTGTATRDFVGWFAREGNPHAAQYMGIADQHGREGGPANAAQARAWYAQAAEAGHADATYNLGTFIEVGTGGPKDVLVAKALFMMANAGGTTMRVDDLRLAPNEQGPVRALVAALREPGQLRAVLQQRGLAPAAGPAPVVRQAMGGAAAAATTGMGPPAAAAPSGTPPSRPRQRVDDDEDEESDALRGHQGTGVSMHWGHLALMVGIANVVLVIAFFKPGASFRMGLMAFGLVGAVGAWRTTGDLDWSPLARAVVALLAAIPLVGMAVCTLLLFKAMRERR
ncbi:hypothetical protein CLU86_1597 [Acidovorax sp. 62]|uniref:tetratricopeptide repeat protein n=1 Tax=Acidovorax sp. 62 TaxID=2035203 RepID=UPI000C194AFF|nr:sel1 repeat family protein [Acidovorax sp. 62]PIF90708.1 hypothetical protein CLU86_1597 [Acidovorax sp. 62]